MPDPVDTDPVDTDPVDQAPEPGLSYEQAREELIAVVKKLESGGAPLDESLALWERGERLASICQEFLDGAQTRVDAARGPATPEPDDEG